MAGWRDGGKARMTGWRDGRMADWWYNRVEG